MKISFLLPSRSRPEKLFAAIENIQSMVSNESYEIILSLDLDDSTINNDEVKERLRYYKHLTYYFDFSNSKVHACNREINKINSDSEIVILMSDDMKVTVKGFDDLIRKEFEDYYGLLHAPDQIQLKRIVTVPIMHIDYLKRFGYIYNPQYTSVYCDDEMTEVAKLLGQYKYLDVEMFEHRHYRGGWGIPDSLMKRNDSNHTYAIDKSVYSERKERNFDLVI